MGLISRKLIAWQLPKIYKDLTGEEMKVDPKVYERMLDAIPAAIDEETGLKINKNWWDNFISGINRVPRPLFSFGLFIMFVIGVVAPETFNKIMVSWSAAPMMFWVVAMTIISAWFGGRIIQEFGGIKMLLGSISPKAVVDNILQSKKQKRRLESNKDFKLRIKNTSEFMTNDDIQRWNEINKRKRED